MTLTPDIIAQYTRPDGTVDYAAAWADPRTQANFGYNFGFDANLLQPETTTTSPPTAGTGKEPTSLWQDIKDAASDINFLGFNYEGVQKKDTDTPIISSPTGGDTFTPSGTPAVPSGTGGIPSTKDTSQMGGDISPAEPIIDAVVDTGSGIVETITNTGTAPTSDIPLADLNALRTTQRGYATDIAESKAATAQEAYTEGVAAIDAATAELLGGITTARGTLETQLGEYQDYIDFGKQALTKLESEEGELFRDFTLDDFEMTPADVLRRKAGEEAIVNRASALGVTGQTAKDLIKFGEDYSYDVFGRERNYFTDLQNRRLNYLTGRADTGLRALDRETGLARDISALDISEGETRGRQKYDLGALETGRTREIGGADVEKLGTFSDIESDYFANKFGLEESRRLHEQADKGQFLGSVFGGAGLGYQMGGPWGALAGGVGGGLINYFAS